MLPFFQSARAAAPDWAKRLARSARLASRSARRSFGYSVADCRVGGLSIRVGVSSEIEHWRADTYATKEPHTLAWLDRHLRDGDVFLDIGANIGLYSLYAGRLRPAAQVYALEPAAHNFGRLCENVRLNGLRNVLPIPAALSDRDAVDVLHVSDIEPGSAFHGVGRPNAGQPKRDAAGMRQGTMAVTLDGLVSRFGLPQPNLIKMDVDGGEGRILGGAEGVFRSRSLRTALIELNPGDGTDVLETRGRLASWGLAWRPEEGPPEGGQPPNYVFVRDGPTT